MNNSHLHKKGRITLNWTFYFLLVCKNPLIRRDKRPEFWQVDLFIIHNNAPVYTTLLIRQCPYSPDLIPYDFFLFPKLSSFASKLRELGYWAVGSIVLR